MEFAERSRGGGSGNGRHDDGEVAERDIGGGSGNRRDGTEEVAGHSRRGGVVTTKESGTPEEMVEAAI